MKKLLPYCTILCGIVLCMLSCSPKKHSTSKSVYHGIKADSGYVTEASLHTLFKINPEDTLFKIRENNQPADTVGRYFITPNGNYVARVDIEWPENFYQQALIEALPDGTIIKKVPLWTGMHHCCWQPDVNNGLQSYGDYFSIPTCGTGSGFCSGHLYFFKDVNDMEANGMIFQSVFTGTLPVYYEYFIDIDGVPEVHNDTVIMHYSKRLLRRKGDKFKVKHSESFDVAYTLQPTGWAATDSTRLKEIEHYLY